MSDVETPAVDSRVTEAIAFVKLSKDAEQAQRDREKDDLRFQVPENAWSDEAKKFRQSTTINGVPIPARPMLSLATLDEPLQLVENGYRDAHLGINVHPLSAEAQSDTAEVIQGIIRSIEVNSRAPAVPRGWSFARSLRCGRGAYRCISEYDQDSPVPGDQRLILKRILYQDTVYLDPFAEEPDWSDGERAAIISDIPFTTYKRKYKKTSLANYSDGDLLALGGEKPDWVSDGDPESRTVRVAEFFYVEHEEETLTITGAGNGGADKAITYDKRVVKWCKVNGIEVLDEGMWPGPYIPIIPTIGKELQPFDGKRRWAGMITNAKSAVNLVNVSASGAVEMASLEPKAPWQMEEGQDAGYEWEYQQANIRNFPVLHYRGTNLDGQRVQGPPARVQVDSSRLGPNMMLLQMGKDFVQSATQTYEPSLGKQTPAHRSGEAIKALQGQGVEGTSNYTGNLADISMTLEAKILLWAIPHFYDRPGRIETILDGELKPRQVMLNAPAVHGPNGQPLPAPEGEKPAYHYNLNAGRYGVTVTIGKSSKSKLEQGETEIGNIMQAAPEQIPLIGPVYFKYRDGPGMKEVAEIMKRQRDHAFPWLADGFDASQPPIQQVLAENQHLKQVAGEMQKAIETKQIEQQAKMQISMIQESAETQRSREKNETTITVAELNALAKELQDTRALFMEERARLGAQRHEAAMASGDHGAALQQGEQAHQQALQQAEQANAHAMQQGAAGHDQALGQQQHAADNALVAQAAEPQETA